MSRSPGYKHVRADPITYLGCSDLGKEEMPTFSCPLSPTTGRKAVPEVIREGELALTISYCNTRESGPCSSFEQHSSAGPAYRRCR